MAESRGRGNAEKASVLLAGTIRWGLARLARPQILFPLIALFLIAVIWGTRGYWFAKPMPAARVPGRQQAFECDPAKIEAAVAHR